MDKSATIHVKDLSPATRAWVMAILQSDLCDDEELTLMLHRPLHSPSPAQRAAARQDLLNVLERLDERTKNVAERDMDAAIEETMRAVRPARE